MDENNMGSEDTRDTGSGAGAPNERMDAPYFTDERVEEYLRVEREQDPEVNRATRPPDDERIEVRCIWLTVLYGPSHVPDLISGLERLGWRGRSGRDESLADYLRQQRTRQFGGSGKVLGPVVRSAEVRWAYLPDRPETDLPGVVDYAFGSLNVVSSSLTALTLQFVLKEEAALAPFRVLRRTDFVTQVDRREDTILAFDGAEDQKRRMARMERRKLKEECASWISEHLPGVFHGAHLKVPFPSCEFVTLSRARPFVDLPSDSPGYPLYDYLQLLGLERTFTTWESRSYPGAKLRVGLGSFDDTHGAEQYTLTLAANTSVSREAQGLDPTESSREDEDRLSRFALDLDFGITTLTMIFALHALSDYYESSLSAIRDDAGTVEVGDVEEAAKKTRRLQSQLVEIGRDVIPISAELQHLAESPIDRTWRFAPVFRSADAEEQATRRKTRAGLRERLLAKLWGRKEANRGDEQLLVENLRRNMTSRFSRLRDLEPEVRQIVNAAASLIGSITQERATEANLTLQRRVAFLTWVATALATITLITTVVDSWGGPASGGDGRDVRSGGSEQTVVQEGTNRKP